MPWSVQRACTHRYIKYRIQNLLWDILAIIQSSRRAKCLAKITSMIIIGTTTFILDDVRPKCLDVRTVVLYDVRTVVQYDVRTVVQYDVRTVVQYDVRTVVQYDVRWFQPEERRFALLDILTLEHTLRRKTYMTSRPARLPRGHSQAFGAD